MIDVQAQKCLWIKKPWREAGLYYAAFSPDSKSVYAGGTSSAVWAFDVRSGKKLSHWYANDSGREQYGHRISCLAVSPDGKWVAAGAGIEGNVYIGSTAESRKVATLKHGGSTLLLVQFAPDSKAIASVAAGKLKIWHTSQWESAQP
jgi:WD40 repeat protein